VEGRLAPGAGAAWIDIEENSASVSGQEHAGVLRRPFFRDVSVDQPHAIEAAALVGTGFVDAAALTHFAVRAPLAGGFGQSADRQQLAAHSAAGAGTPGRRHSHMTIEPQSALSAPQGLPSSSG